MKINSAQFKQLFTAPAFSIIWTIGASKFVKFSMLLFRRAQFKIFNSIIIFNAIDMVDYFSGKKVSPKMFLHHKTMFSNIFLSCKRMIGDSNKYSSTRFLSSTFPRWTTFSTMRNANIFSMLERFFLSKQCNTSFNIRFFRLFSSNLSQANLSSRFFGHFCSFKHRVSFILLATIIIYSNFMEVNKCYSQGIENFQKVRIDDYAGGQNSNNYGDKIEANQGTSVINGVIKNKGQIYTRTGQALFNSDTRTAAFNGIGRFDPTASISYMIAASGTSIVRALASDTNWTKISGSNLQTAGISTQFIQANNLFFILNGTNSTAWYDGTNYTVSSGWPVSPPTVTTAAWLNNYLFAAGNSTNPDWIYVSSNVLVSGPTVFPATTILKVESGDGQGITRLEPYRTGDIIVYKTRSIYDLNISNVDSTCTPQPTCQWSYSLLTKDVGTQSPRSVVSLGNDQWFLSGPPYGIRSVTRTQFDKTFVNLISQPIQDIFDGTADRSINATQVSKAAGVYFDNKFLLAISVGSSSVNNLVVVYDFITSSWSIIDGWYPQSWIVFNNNLYYADANDGRVVQCFTGNVGDIGTVIPAASGPTVGIPFTYYSKILDFDNPENFKQLDSIGLEFQPTGNYNANISINLDNSGWQTAGSIPLTANAVTLPVMLPFTLNSPGITYKTLELSRFGEFKKIQIGVSLSSINQQIILQKISSFARIKPWRRE